MAFKCEVCGKGPASGNNVSHSMKHTRRRWKPNLQSVKVTLENGKNKRIKACTECMRSGKVTRAI